MTALAGAIADPGEYNLDTKKLISRGTRTTASTTTTTTELGVFRLDGVQLKAGRSYMIATSSLLINSSVADDEVRIRLRAATDGDTATTSSPEIVLGVVNATPHTTDLTVPRFPATDEVLSILLTVVRTSGTGNCLIEDVSGDQHIFVYDIGKDVGNSGISL